ERLALHAASVAVHAAATAWHSAPAFASQNESDVGYFSGSSSEHAISATPPTKATNPSALRIIRCPPKRKARFLPSQRQPQGFHGGDLARHHRSSCGASMFSPARRDERPRSHPVGRSLMREPSVRKRSVSAEAYLRRETMKVIASLLSVAAVATALTLASEAA